MDSALNVASTVAGVLSLAIQLVHLTQRYTSRMMNLPRSVASYLTDLTVLKQLLSDIQNGLALPLATSGLGSATYLALTNELRIIEGELENVQDKLHNAQTQEACFMTRNILWPIPEDETIRWASNLRMCRERIESTIMISGLQLQLQSQAGIEELRKRAETTDQRRENHLILDWICDESYKRKHAELISSHHPSTGQWIFAAPEFQSWVSKESGTLWCHGNPGTGKTQLTSLVVEYLLTVKKVAYFYCDYHSSGDKNITTKIAAAILRQLVNSRKDIPAAVKDMYQTLGNGRDKLKLDDITTLIRRICLSEPGVFIVVDAIDECGYYRKPVLQLLRKISKGSANLLISGRSHVTELDRVFNSYSQLEVKAPASDIRCFAEGMIASSELSELIPDNSKQDIVRHIADQASGIFLIAALKCIHLTHLSRFSEIRNAVRAHSNGLDDLYKESMERIMLQPLEKRKTATKALSWIYHAKRQLSVAELVHALAIDCNEEIPTYEDVVSEKTVLDVCAGLVLIDAKSRTLRFVHHTLQEYFQASYETWFCGEKRYITKACLIYLRLMFPKRSIADSLSSYPFMRYAAAYWGTHARDEYHGEFDNIALATFHNTPTLEKISILMDNNHESLKTLPMFPCQNLAVQMSARFGALEVLKMLLRRQHSVEGADPSGRTALHWAARGGFVDVVQALLREGAEASPKTNNGMTPFHWAAKHGHEKVIDELMPRINPSEATHDDRTALHWASSQGHISIVKKLLAGNRIDVGCQSLDGWTPLHWAACSGKKAVVMYGANSGQGAGNPPAVPREVLSLSGGESSGHEEVTEFLLKSGADPNLRNTENQTALHWAAVSGNARIVSLILSYGAELTTQDIHGLTAWQLAVENKVDDTVINLLAPPNEWKEA
ncbi:hypothetical protein F4680DRAFT_433578 [Xylaria scruposa]|nr:hypothetical protein F4680DRAFT_433578 [Xylaria scruposa]